MLRVLQTDVEPERDLEQDAEDQICCFDVSVPQCYGLEALVRDGPLTLGELADRLYLEKSTASRVVDALERKGYVARGPHPGDGRALRLTATPSGRRLVKKIRASLINDAKAVLADLSPAFRREAARLLTKLTAVAAERLGRGPGGRDGGTACAVGAETEVSCSPRQGRER
jgi:DNA-binding MarR family transcriptional regulator